MCFFKPPELKPLPTPPRADDPSVLARQQLEMMKLNAAGGTAATVKTDLDPKSLVGKRVRLGV
jgi:hypothetical protein